jgi:sigma-B regulation protein RsbU (phosphoserine phosphatase)
MNRDIMAVYLQGQGHTVDKAENGEKALEMLRAAGGEAFDLILLDLVMPRMDGVAVLERIAADDELRQIPVIMISAVEEMKSIVRCIQLGAQDYFFKPFDPTLLRARINACLDRHAFYRALLKTQELLTHELAEAASYVNSLLPEPLLDGPVEARWRFIPSAQLGGDGFGYHWLDDDRLAMYLLDVSGHGVGAALLSVSVINMLRGQSLRQTDFGQPSEVMAGLNRAFPMGEQQGKFFTIWYGVYRPSSRQLEFCSAGHPPAVIASPRDGVARLRTTEGLPVGVLTEARYECTTVALPPDGYLYLFSDGIFEIMTEEGRVWTLRDLTSVLGRVFGPARAEPERVEQAIRDLTGAAVFDDDFSLLVFHFR